MTECLYCGSVWKEDKRGCCGACGAPNKIAKLARYDPYEYDGYIVYSFKVFYRMGMEFVFYKGRHLEGKVFVGEDEIASWNPSVDPMPMILERLVGK